MILEEGNRPYPLCHKCDMFVSYKTLNVQHLETEFCRWGEERKWCRLAEKEVRSGTATAITAYGIPLVPVASFK